MMRAAGLHSFSPLLGKSLKRDVCLEDVLYFRRTKQKGHCCYVIFGKWCFFPLLIETGLFFLA